jgi:hypothetical protein
MLGHRELTMRDYTEILKRRFWLILASAVLFLGIGLGVCHILPPQYMSQTLVLIEQQKVPEDYVKPVVNEDLNGRLASMKEQILSRSRIEPIITRFDLYRRQQIHHGRPRRYDAQGHRDQSDSLWAVVARHAGLFYHLQGTGRAHGAAGMRRDHLAFRQRES